MKSVSSCINTSSIFFFLYAAIDRNYALQSIIIISGPYAALHAAILCNCHAKILPYPKRRGHMKNVKYIINRPYHHRPRPIASPASSKPFYHSSASSRSLVPQHLSSAHPVPRPPVCSLHSFSAYKMRHASTIVVMNQTDDSRGFVVCSPPYSYSIYAVYSSPRRHLPLFMISFCPHLVMKSKRGRVAHSTCYPYHVYPGPAPPFPSHSPPVSLYLSLSTPSPRLFRPLAQVGRAGSWPAGRR